VPLRRPLQHSERKPTFSTSFVAYCFPVISAE
jgi:hypothetical protein